MILHEQQCVVVVQHLAVASKKTQLTYEYLIEKKRLCEAENQRLAILQPLAQLTNIAFFVLAFSDCFFGCKNSEAVRHTMTHRQNSL